MPTASQTPPLHVLRSILRHIKSAPKEIMPKKESSSSTPLSTSSSNPLVQHVLNQYKSNKHLSPTSPQCIQLRRMAFNFHVLNKDLRERGRLHELDGGVEKKLSPKEMSRRAAARAGLLLPEENVV